MVVAGHLPSMLPGPHATLNRLPSISTTDLTASASQSDTTYFNVRDNNSFHGLELSTPAAKEGFRAEAMTPNNTPVNSKPKHHSAVQLTPAACKHLQDVAARLYVIAHYQQYDPQAVSSFDQQHDAMPQLAQVLLPSCPRNRFA